MKAHFIGIGGVGMSATAKLLRDSGWQVTGSDEELYPPISTFLATEKLPYATPYAAANLPSDVDLIVIGKNAKLVPESNAEVASAMQSSKRIASFPEILGELSAKKISIVVAGSYGKSSCAALLSHVLGEAGLDPSFFIGAVPLSPPTSAKIGKGELFVFEGDEYPSSNSDDRSKFLHLHPRHLLLTPLAHDHVNIFPTVESYLAPFSRLVGLLPADGVCVAASSGSLSRGFLGGLKRSFVTYGLASGNFSAGSIEWSNPTQFEILRDGKLLLRASTSQLGEHSIENAIGVAAFVFSLGLMSTDVFAKAIASFKGVTRRLDRKSDKTALPIYEGFGSSYEKAKSAIAAVKRSFPSKKLIVVFEPHTFSWRSLDTLHWYDDVFDGVDRVFIFNPPLQGAQTHNQASLEDIMSRVSASGVNFKAIQEPKEALVALSGQLTGDEALLFLSSGPLGGIIEDVTAMAEDKFPIGPAD
jgi:UDP-N-acetylmuramate: L-alanyl-gamma-D-glutamyl-meso-diaminopimelate ligase